VDLSVDLAANLTDELISTVMSTMMQNLMDMNNEFVVDGVSYPANIEMLFESAVPEMNGTLISADNVTACTCRVV